jgi:hypothetical protein
MEQDVRPAKGVAMESMKAGYGEERIAVERVSKRGLVQAKPAFGSR